jgi:hypothetical protein
MALVSHAFNSVFQPLSKADSQFLVNFLNLQTLLSQLLRSTNQVGRSI